MATLKEIEKQKEAMRKLGMSEEEIEELMEYDKEIDKGKKNLEHDLTKEQEKQARAVANQKRGADKPTEEKEKKPKKTKENPVKETVIAEIAKFLAENGEISAENVEIVNKQGEISFTVGENTYKLALTQRRKPKN